MSFLAPAAAALAITLPAIVALYFLRIRRPTRVIPALHLWPDQIRDRQANVPWQRLRFSWLLLLQLLAAAVLVAAAVQPVLPASAGLAAHSIVLLDASAPMQAKDIAPSRFEQARHLVSAMIDELGPQDRMTLIALQATVFAYWPLPTAVIVDELHQGPDVIDGCCGEDSMAQIEHVSGLPSRAIQNLSGSLSNDGPGRHQGHRIEISLDTDVSSDAVPGVIQIRPPVHADDIPARLPHPRKKISRAGSEMD